MALTRKFLSAMGIEEDKIDQIISAHSETVNGLKEQIDQYKEDAEKMPAIQKELDELKKTIKDTEKDSWKVKYEALKEDYEEFKDGIEKAKVKKNIETAVRKTLQEIGIPERRIDAVARVTDMDSLKLDADGNIEGAEEFKASLKKEWDDFIETTGVKGASTPTPPQNTGGKVITREEILAIKDGTERRQRMAENPELFDLPVSKGV